MMKTFKSLKISIRNWLLIKLAGNSSVVINASVLGTLYVDSSKYKNNLYVRVHTLGGGFVEYPESVYEYNLRKSIINLSDKYYL